MVCLVKTIREVCPHIVTVLKGQFTPKSKLPVVLFVHLDSFDELSSFGDIGRRNFCLLSNIMGLNGAHTFEKFNSNVQKS